MMYKWKKVILEKRHTSKNERKQVITHQDKNEMDYEAEAVTELKNSKFILKNTKHTSKRNLCSLKLSLSLSR